MMITGGVDLASQNPKTAVCLLTWAEGRASVDQLTLGANDEAILELIAASDKVGLDVPLGWPIAFAQAVGAAIDGPWPATYRHADNSAYRLRRTDLWLWRALKSSPPLSVSADRIALPAMRAAALLSRQDSIAPRDGSGSVVEVYPAAALRRWGFASRRYKGGENLVARTTLVADFLRETRDWLALSSTHEQLCVASDDAFDALICALVARAAATQRVEAIPPEDRASALREGWIAVPLEGSLTGLAHN